VKATLATIANGTPKVEGSWWPEWTRWLSARSGDLAAPPPVGIGDAKRTPARCPGDYVHL
jgi:polyhydroxyalkanoate synthase subunit PhaC